MRAALISTLALVATAGSASIAAAQEAPACKVEILRAPPEVQAVVEDWVRAERVCGPALKVRIVPTPGGLYVLATDASGRARERVVPDATTAGVLIASWAADDGAPAPVTAAAPAPPASVPPLAPTAIAMEPPAPPAPPPVTPAPPLAPPSTYPSLVVLVDGGRAQRRGLRSLDAGLVMTMSVGNASIDNASFGVKVGADLVARHGVRLGVAGGFVRSVWAYTNSFGYPEQVETSDVRVVARVAVERQRGRWSGRLELGLGAVITSVATMSFGSTSGVSPYGELGATVGFQLTPGWRLRAGPVLSLTAQHIHSVETGVEILRGGALEGWAGVDRAF
jgi:hypothetical protein